MPSSSSKRKRALAETIRDMSCARRATLIGTAGSRSWCGIFQAFTARSPSRTVHRRPIITVVRTPTAFRRSRGRAPTRTAVARRAPRIPSTTHRSTEIPQTDSTTRRRHGASWSNSSARSHRVCPTRRRWPTLPRASPQRPRTSAPTRSRGTTQICRMGRRAAAGSSRRAAGSIRPSSIGRAMEPPKASSLR